MANTNPARLSAEDIIARVLQHNQLFFDGDIPHLKREQYYERIAEDDAKRYIVDLLAETEKISTPKSEYQEALDRLRLLDRLQLHLSEKLKERQFLVNVRNGVFDAVSGKLIENRSDKKFSYCCDFRYRPRCTLDSAPNFKRYLEKSVGEDNSSCFMRSGGYILSDIIDAKKAVFFIGDGNTGKSLWCDLFTDLIGNHAVSNEPFERIGNEFSRYNFMNRKLNISRETNRAVLKNESAFKSVVACENICGRMRYHDHVDFVSQLKLLVASNHPPVFSKLDEAILGRMVIIFFHSTLKESELDRGLKEKLYAERDVIGSMFLDALQELVTSGYDFKMSQESIAYLNSCRIELHSAEEFLRDRCDVQSGAVVSSSALWTAYRKYCEENGVDALGRNTFFQQVLWHYSGIIRGKVEIGGKRVNGFIGLRFKPWHQQQADPNRHKEEQPDQTDKK